jgi:hypothetical protein
MPRKLLIALLLALGLASPAAATPMDEFGREAEQFAREAAEQILSTLRVIMMTIPQYEAPEVLDNGDIIIRRKAPRAEPPAPRSRPLPDDRDTLRTGTTDT